MALPKITIPTFSLTIPSTEKKARFRPFTVKEEKVLLLAKQSGEQHDQFTAIRDVVENCAVEDMDVKKLALFDLEYLFVKLRAQSISNEVEVSYTDGEDEVDPKTNQPKTRTFKVDMDKVVVKGIADKKKNKYEVAPGVIVTLRYPPVSLYTDPAFFALPDDEILGAVLKACLEKVYHEETVVDCASEDPKELDEFINSIPAKVYGEMREFLDNVPTLNYEIKYTNDKGTERTITLSTMNDFFPSL